MEHESNSPSLLVPAVALAVIVLCLAGLGYLLWPIHALVFQVFALAGLLAGFRACPPFTDWLRGLPMVHRRVFVGLIVTVLLGHFTLSTRRFFPFVAWDIFCAVSEQHTVFCRELIGTTEGGHRVRLLVEQLFPSIVQFDLPPNTEPEAMQHLVDSLTRAYNEHHATDTLRRVDLMLMAVDLNPPADQSRSEPSCELLQRFELSSVH